MCCPFAGSGQGGIAILSNGLPWFLLVLVALDGPYLGNPEILVQVRPNTTVFVIQVPAKVPRYAPIPSIVGRQTPSHRSKVCASSKYIHGGALTH